MQDDSREIQTSVCIQNIGDDSVHYAEMQITFSDEWIKCVIHGDSVSDVRLETDSAALFLGFMDNYMKELWNRHLENRKCVNVAPYPTEPISGRNGLSGKVARNLEVSVMVDPPLALELRKMGVEMKAMMRGDGVTLIVSQVKKNVSTNGNSRRQ